MTLWKWADEKQAVVELEIRWRHGHQDPGHAADDKRHHETDRPQDRHREANAPAVHCEQPVEHLHAGGNRDDHGHDAEETVDVRAGTHGEEVVQPDDEGENADYHGGGDHRTIAEQRLAGERRDNFRKDTERRQD